MAIKIKRSSGDSAPGSLAAGQLAYAEGSTNGGTLYYGEIGGTVRAIAGRKYVDKLDGIEAGAQVNVIEAVVDDTTPQLGGDLDVNGYSIVSATNANIVVQPGGSGAIVLGAASNSGVLVGQGTGAGYMGSYNSYDFTLSANINNASGASLTLKPGTNGNLELYPSGTGKIVASAGTTQLGTGSAAPTLTTNGNYGLTLNTNNGTNASNIVFTSGANGSITANMNGNSSFISINTSTSSSPLAGRQVVTSSSTISNASLSLGKQRSDILLSAMTDEPVVMNFALRDSSNAGKNFARFLANYYGTGTDPILQMRVSTDGFTTNKTVATFASVGILTGVGNGNALVATPGTGSLTLGTNASSGSPTDSSTIQIDNGTNSSITLTPQGTGKVVIAGDLQVTGTTTTVNSTTVDIADVNITLAKGAANAAAANGGGITVEGPTTAATITYANSDDSWNLNKKTKLAGIAYPTTDGSNGQALVTNGSGTLSFATVLTEIVQDTSPQLGANLDVNGYSIISVSNGDISIAPNGTGKVQLDGVYWPAADGTNGQVLVTNGAGQASWSTISSGGATAFTGLSDVPASYSGSGGYYVRVNSGATALEFTQHIDDGTF